MNNLWIALKCIVDKFESQRTEKRAEKKNENADVNRAKKETKQEKLGE